MSCVLCAPRDDVANPDACLVTGILPETLQREGIPEVQAWEEICVNSPCRTCVVGYNSLRFDDEFVRYGLYRHLFDARENGKTAARAGTFRSG